MNWMIQQAQPWNPLAEVANMQREMNRLFGDFTRAEEVFPAVNVWSNADQTTVSAEVPGLDPEQIRLTVNGRYLTLEGERKADSQGAGEAHRRERVMGAFARTVALPYETDPDQVKAMCRNGILTITLPRHEAAKPRAIRVQAA